MKSWLVVFAIAIVAIIPAIASLTLVWYYYTNTLEVQRTTPIASIEYSSNSKLEVGSRLNVKACKVIDGFRYDMYLDGGRWIEAHLAVSTKDEANDYVVKLLESATSPPNITLLRQVGNYWIVDLHLTVEDKQINLVDLLSKKGFLLQ